MAKQPPPGQEQYAPQQAKERAAERSKEQALDRPAERTADSFGSTPVVDASAVNGKQKPGMVMDAQKATAGRAGERNIGVEMIPVPVGLNIPCRFNVKTLSGNSLEVTLEQTVYRKTFTGRGTVATTVIPVAPIGTPGKLTAHDLTTGEIVEQPWKWRPLGQSFSLWAIVKKLFGIS